MTTHALRSFAILLTVLAPVGGDEVLDPAKAKTDADGTAWYNVQLLGVEGKGWGNTRAPFDRLPAKAEGVVRPAVWGLSRHSAGMCVRFATDAPAIRARWTLTSAKLEMPHMPATGVSGVDLYVRVGTKWRWLACGRPTMKTNTLALVDNLPEEKREYMLYLPLYNGVESVELGVPKANKVHTLPRPAGKEKPIVFYGTSITQGGCASRPGMVHTAILGRWLDRPVINLGFSGNGTMDKEVADLLAELDPCVYVIDCLPNMTAQQVAERTEPLVQALRKRHPDTPIVLVEDRTYTDAFLVQERARRNQTSRAALKDVYQKLKSAGVGNLHYLSGEELLGEDGEGTVDGSHPTDLGFLRQAEAFAGVLRPLLQP
jgi:lysophospholipase L1-like esterase